MHAKFLLALCLWSFVSFAQNEKVRYQLSITVKDSITGKPLEDATITITKHNDIHLTNQYGKAVFDTLKAGHYHITATFIGYHSQEMIIELPAKKDVSILLCPASFHLHETVIEANATRDVPTYSVQSSALLNATQIEKLRGQNLGDLLKNVNGLTTLNTGPGIAKPVLRGLHSNRLVLLNNGVKQEGQQWGSEHAPEIDPFAVDRVEVIKGAASVEYGPEAIGGAIRLSPHSYKNTNGVDGEVSMQGFSNNKQGAISTMLQGTHFKNQQLQWRAQGSLRKAGDSRAPDYVISNTGLEEQNGSISLAYQHKQLSAEFFMSVFNTKIGIMRAAHIGSSTDLYRAIESETPLYIQPFTYDIGKPYQQVWHETQSAKIGYQFKTVGKLTAQISRQLNSRQEYDLGVSWNTQSPTHTEPAYDLTLKTYTYDGFFEHNSWKHIKGKIGVSIMDQSNYTAGIQKPLIPNFISLTYGAFIVEKWSKGRWTAELGTRFDKRNQTTYSRNTVNEIVTQSRNYQSATFVLGGAYAFTERLKLSSTFSSAWRPPAINELYSNGLHNGTATYEIGDSNLVPERSYNVDVNLKYQHPKWIVEVSVYNNTINNFIYQLPVQPPTVTLRGTFPTFQFTQTDVLMRGTEVNITYLLHQHISVNAAASYLHAQDLTHNQPLIYMPANRSKMGIQYQREHSWKLEHVFAEISWQYVAEQTRYPANLDYKNPPPAYHLVDINLGFEIPVGKEHIKISASVKNVMNTSYRDYLNRFRYFTDEPGRNFILRATVPFTILRKH